MRKTKAPSYFSSRLCCDTRQEKLRRQATEAAQIHSGEQVVILRSRVYLSTCKDDRGSWRLGSVWDGDPLWRRLPGRQSRTGCHHITTDALPVVLPFIVSAYNVQIYFGSFFSPFLTAQDCVNLHCKRKINYSFVHIITLLEHYYWFNVNTLLAAVTGTT